MIHSDRLSKEEDQINKIVKPILYELLKEGSVDLTPKNDSNEKFFDLKAAAGTKSEEGKLRSLVLRLQIGCSLVPINSA